MKQRTFNVLSHEEFDNLVHDNFPARTDYEYCAATEATNDTARTYKNVGSPKRLKFNVDPEWVAARAQQQIEDFDKWARGDVFGLYGIGTHQILEGLVRKGAIPGGDYLIEVSW